MPTALTATSAIHTQNTAVGSGIVVKAAPGSLYSFEASADSTLSAAAWWLMIFDAIAFPADGTVTPAKVYAVASGTAQVGGTFGTSGVAFPVGISMCVSTTGPFTKTASAHAFLGADYS